ncbi:hypothetical protein WJX82_007877 [Trebouxia sp. C0006]
MKSDGVLWMFRPRGLCGSSAISAGVVTWHRYTETRNTSDRPPLIDRPRVPTGNVVRIGSFLIWKRAHAHKQTTRRCPYVWPTQNAGDFVAIAAQACQVASGSGLSQLDDHPWTELLASTKGNNELCDRVLCIAFGPPPSALSTRAATTLVAHQQSQVPAKPDVFWNFLLANVPSATTMGICLPKMTLSDALPAIMSTAPMSSGSSIPWLEAVTELAIASQSPYSSQQQFDEIVDELLAAGVVQTPAYMGHTWFLGRCGVSQVAARLKSFNIKEFKIGDRRSNCVEEYVLGATALGAEVPKAEPRGLLLPLKLQSSTTSFFKPLTGAGVQWITDEEMTVEMVGGGFDLVKLTLNPPKLSRGVRLPGNAAASSAASVDEKSAPQAADEQLSTDEFDYSLTIKGEMTAASTSVNLLLPEAPVDVFLHLKTHFGQQKLLLQKEPCEQDAQVLKARLASVAVEYQLQRAVFAAAAGLISDNKETHQKGREILNVVDRLEGWCRTELVDLSSNYKSIVSKTQAQTSWHATRIKQIVEHCCSESVQAAADHMQDCSMQVFSRLSAAQPHLDSNRTSIATVLASPLLVEYETDKLKQAGKVSLVIGATVLMCFLPLVGMGALAGEALAASAAFATISTPELYLGAGVLDWLQDLYKNNVAYLAKLTELVELLAPNKKPQQDVSTMENILYKYCSGQVADGNAGCKQMLSVHLNQIWAMSQLRKQVQYSCLVGCVGDINAGKTTLVRALLGLPPEEKGHLTENATRHVTAIAMPMRTAKGLAELPASPMLVDTPGMFDTDSVLADTAVRYLGAMALYVIVLTPSRSGRLDKTMQDRIIEIASMGKPTLVCINQISRYMDWCSSAAEAKSKCEEVCESIRTKTPKCGSLKVYLTEMVQHDAHYQDMKTRDIKNVEDVRTWIGESAQICGFDLDGSATAPEE